MLPTVLFISLVVTLLCTALIGAAYYKNRLLARDRNRIVLSRNAHSALNFLAVSEQIPYRQPLVIDLYGTGEDSVSLLKREWGFFDMAMAKAFRGRQAHGICGLLGATPDKTANTALYLSDEDQPLSLAGRSIIRGGCLLPEAGIRYETIEGKSFTGEAPKPAAIKQSGADAPELPAAFLARVRWLQGLPGDLPSLPTGRMTDFRQRSFLEEPILFFSPGDFLLSTPLEGNVIVCSRGTLTVSSTARLKNVILVAKKIIVRSGFEGNLQAIAHDTLLVESGCRLTYPSAVAAVGSGRCHLAIGSGAVLEGLAVVGSRNGNPLENTLSVEEGAQVTGQIYAGGMVMLRGSLHGSLACQRLYVLTPSALYENLLLDAEIDLDKRPKAFLASPLLTKGTRLKTLQWLD